ncbi:hypothetical protein PTSG_07797 [Salpingoeca rosetta]|uniref:Coiled-coil domain-containing protein 39 n=1 Tax=Salpingoeca rosetta (strain ATCC 50818 / BSB-021) TaxID=946362 RepID=F2UGC7_SALR5|nr:uncharacterized protein PTSG_07797 [Salpingoeca rosetta]EGD75677.1 hypothetical protein PTSG_07797 [Salpingoeca rosetta]|eukprot:XP_004991598.1 hypothetical protein PTSG_07797 [Salpingoeca rosetta]
MSRRRSSMDLLDDDSDADDGTDLFEANTGNKELDKKVKQAEKKLLSVEAELEASENRAKALSDHFKNVQQEIQHTQALLQAKKREHGNESHLIQMCQQTERQLQKEITRVQQEVKTITDRINNNQNSILKAKQTLDDIKEDMKWDETELNKWMARRDLEHQVMETQAQRMGLDKASEEYAKLHEQQQEITGLWEGVIAKMEERDQEITTEAEAFANLRQHIAENDALIREKDAFLAEQKKTNREVEAEVNMTERRMLKAREHQLREEKQLDTYTDELRTLRITLSKTATDLSAKKAELTSLQKQLVERTRRCDDLEQEVAKARENITSMQKRQLTAEEREQQLAQLLEGEEREQESILKEVAAMRQVQFKAAERVKQLEEEHARLSQELKGSEAANAKAQARIRTMEKDLSKQAQLMYQLDFQIANLERKLQKLEGKQTSGEKEKYEAQIAELKEQLSAQQQTNKLLHQQISAIDDQIRVGRRRMDTDAEEHKRQEEYITQLTLATKRLEKDLKRTVTSKEDLLVEENILKLEIKRVRQALNDKADRVYTLEQRKLQLQQTMKDRLEEIQIHKDLLQKQQREVEADKSAINKELNERFGRIDQLKKRYEIIVMSMDSTDDGEPKTHAYYLVKHAQEREELQRQGDELQEQITEEERQLRGLHKTLSKMTKRNTKLKHSLRGVSEDTPEQQTKAQLEKKYHTLLEKHKALNHERNELDAELRALEEADLAAARDEQQLQSQVDRAAAELSALDSELTEQMHKLQRATRQSEQLKAEHAARAKADGNDAELAHKDFQLRQLRDTIGRMMRGIDGVVRNNADVAVQLQMLYDQHGIKAPTHSVPGSRYGSSRGSSVASTRSTRRTTQRTLPPTANDVVAKYTSQRPVSTTTFEFGLPTRPESGRSGLTTRPTTRSTAARTRGTRKSTTVTAGRTSAGPRGTRTTASAGGLGGLSVSGSRPLSARSSASTRRSAASTSGARGAARRGRPTYG